MGRLKPGWTEQRADAYIKTISPAFMQATLHRPTGPRRQAFLANKLGDGGRHRRLGPAPAI